MFSISLNWCRGRGKVVLFLFEMTERDCEESQIFLTYISLSLDRKIVRTVMKISLLKILCSFNYLKSASNFNAYFIHSNFGSDNFFRMVLAYLWEMRNCFQISRVISIELLSKFVTVTPIRCSSK